MLLTGFHFSSFDLSVQYSTLQRNRVCSYLSTCWFNCNFHNAIVRARNNYGLQLMAHLLLAHIVRYILMIRSVIHQQGFLFRDRYIQLCSFLILIFEKDIDKRISEDNIAIEFLKIIRVGLYRNIELVKSASDMRAAIGD